jgi:hypothetical protein
MTPLKHFELDHINPFEKTSEVGTMIFQGWPFESIRQEIDKCRLLCIACHCAITFVQSRSGLLRSNADCWTMELQSEIDRAAKKLRGLE